MDITYIYSSKRTVPLALTILPSSLSLKCNSDQKVTLSWERSDDNHAQWSTWKFNFWLVWVHAQLYVSGWFLNLTRSLPAFGLRRWVCHNGRLSGNSLFRFSACFLSQCSSSFRLVILLSWEACVCTLKSTVSKIFHESPLIAFKLFLHFTWRNSKLQTECQQINAAAQERVEQKRRLPQSSFRIGR